MSRDFMNAANSVARSDPAVAAALDADRRLWSFQFPDGAVLLRGLEVLQKVALDPAMRDHAFRVSQATGDYSHRHDALVFLGPPHGSWRFDVKFWTTPPPQRGADEGIVSFALADDFAKLRIIIEFQRRMTAGVAQHAADRATEAVAAAGLGWSGVPGEGGVALVAPVTQVGPKQLALTVNASDAGPLTMTWLGYQLYLLRDLLPIEQIMDERTAAGLPPTHPRPPKPPPRHRGPRLRDLRQLRQLLGGSAHRQDEWAHFVPYEPDIASALAKLREQEFRAGRYDSLGQKGTPATVDEAVARAGAEGTASVLDVIGGVRAEVSPGAVALLPADRLVELFGTDRPTRADIRSGPAASEFLGRGEAACIVTYDGDRPSELYFTGVAFD